MLGHTRTQLHNTLKSVTKHHDPFDICLGSPSDLCSHQAHRGGRQLPSPHLLDKRNVVSKWSGKERKSAQICCFSSKSKLLKSLRFATNIYGIYGSKPLFMYHKSVPAALGWFRLCWLAIEKAGPGSKALNNCHRFCKKIGNGAALWKRSCNQHECPISWHQCVTCFKPARLVEPELLRHPAGRHRLSKWARTSRQSENNDQKLDMQERRHHLKSYEWV